MTRLSRISLVLAVTLQFALPSRASDHADPVSPLTGPFDPLQVRRSDGGLTGLFAFPTQNRRRIVEDAGQADGLALVLCVHRAAGAPPFPGLSEHTFKIHLDLTSKVRIAYPKSAPANSDDQQMTLRYGGIVEDPEAIQENVVISMRLDPQANRFTEKSVFAINKAGQTPIPLAAKDWFVGLRDDPFILPDFLGTNVVAMVIHIPLNRLPANRGEFLLWATTERHGVQSDHVGRSQRTQLPRFGLLNTLHPRDHVKAIREARDHPGLIGDYTRVIIPTEFMYRPFDLQPDVMIYSQAHAEQGYPNGRRLEDDIAKLACLNGGDCQLYELSFAPPRHAESKTHSQYVGGRPTANDKPFLAEFPYLAEPWPNREPAPKPTLTTRSWVITILLVFIGIALFLLPWWLYARTLKRLRKTQFKPTHQSEKVVTHE